MLVDYYASGLACQEVTSVMCIERFKIYPISNQFVRGIS